MPKINRISEYKRRWWKKFLKDTCHNLYDMAIHISEYIKESIQLDEEAYNWMMNIFKDMNDIDKESDSFRYPFSIKVKDKYL